jgi:HEAT repeat protein
LFEQADPTSFGDYKWSLGFAVSFAPDPNCYDRIIQLITDKSQGSARSGLVRALARFEHPDRNKVLCDLLNEEWSIAVVAVEVIGILKLIEYRKLIVPFTTHSEQYVRQKTKAALAKLDKFEAK